MCWLWWLPTNSVTLHTKNGHWIHMPKRKPATQPFTQPRPQHVLKTSSHIHDERDKRMGTTIPAFWTITLGSYILRPLGTLRTVQYCTVDSGGARKPEEGGPQARHEFSQRENSHNYFIFSLPMIFHVLYYYDWSQPKSF